MNRKSNAYFIIFLLLFSMLPVSTVSADSPIKYNKELLADSGLTGAFFTNDNADGFYVSLIGDNSIRIDSDVHYVDKIIKIKKTALDSRFKKFNGINIGATHISDDGIVNNYILPVVVDGEFIYITVDFSTIIINGMTGTTTTTLTGLSGNQSISVPDGSSYDLNITNNQASVWTINGTNFSKRRLLTLNNSSEALTNFQVKKVQDYYSGMQADMDDRLYTVYENDSLIPFWDEDVVNSINATNYMKIPSIFTTTGAKVWMYYGNSDLSSANSGDDTFIQYHGVATSSFLDSLIVTVPVIYEGKVRKTSSTSNIKWGLANTNDRTDDEMLITTGNDVDNLRYVAAKNEGTETYQQEAPTLTTNVWYHAKIVHTGSAVHGYYDGNEVSTGITTNLPNENMGLIMALTVSTGEQEYSFARKYTATEPTWAADGEEQTASGTRNITASVAGDNNTQSYNTSQSREFTLTPNGSTNNVIINTTSTDYDVIVTTYWTEDTTLIEETVASGYVKQYINYTPSLNITSAVLNTTILNDLTAHDYLGTTASTLNDVSKTTTRVGQEVNASVGSLTKDVEYLWNVTIPYNNIPTVGVISNQTAHIGVSKSFTAPPYSDPEGLPIDTYYWQFGDGDNSSNQNPTHTYTSVGVYDANCTVTETATISPQAVLRGFTVDVGVQPPQNVTTVPQQTNVSIDWDDYTSADKYSVYELEDGIPYVTTNPTVDGVKDAIYDSAHEFLIYSPNPENPGDYETSYPVRTALGAYFFHEAVDNDDKLGDDDLIYYFDTDNNGLTVDDPAWKITNNIVKKYLWNGTTWQVTGVSSAVGESTGGGSHYPKHELFIPVAELGANWTNGSTVKVLVKREDSALSPDVVSWYPYGNINNTDTSLWKELVLNQPTTYDLLANVTPSNYTALNLTPFTIYHGAVSAWNGTDESDYTLFDVITEDLPVYNVSGYVFDDLGNTIAGATVWSQNGYVVEITTSDANGYYIVYNSREGNYSIYANKTGYAQNFTDVYVTENLTNINVTLTRVKCTREMLSNTYNLLLLILGACFILAFPKRGEVTERDTGLNNVLFSFLGTILAIFLAQIIVSGQVVESFAFESQIYDPLQHYLLYLSAVIMFVVFALNIVYYIRQRVDL